MAKNTSYEQLTHNGSPFELQDMFVGGVPYKVFKRGPKTLYDVFMKAAAFTDHEFIVNGNMRLTFGQALLLGK